MDIQELAAEAAQWFETAQRATGDTETGPREDGGSYVRTKDGAPQWVADLVYTAHGDFLPDDWRYACIRAAVDHIAETGEEDSAEFADGYVDVYTGARIEWLGSNLNRAAYCDEAQEEGLAASDAGVIDLIGVGQYMEASEVFGLVYEAIQEEADARVSS